MILYIHASCQIIHFTTSILATLESILHQQPKWPFDNISQISHSHFLTLPMALTTLRIKPRNIPQLTGPYMVHHTTPPALHSGPSASFLHPVHILGSLLLFFRAFILAAPSALNILTKYSHCSPSSFSHTESTFLTTIVIYPFTLHYYTTFNHLPLHMIDCLLTRASLSNTTPAIHKCLLSTWNVSCAVSAKYIP